MRPPLRLRLLLRDLGAALAFTAVALSGQLPLPALALVALGTGVALLGWRPFHSRGGLTALLVAGVGLVLGAAVLRGGMDPVVAACTFAGLLSTQRLLSGPTPSTDAQVFLISLLMVAGGAALSGDLLFAPTLFLYAVFTALAMGLGVVEAATPEGESVPVRAVVRPLVVALGFAVLGSLAFFVLFPRLSWNVAGRRLSPGLGTPTTGFADSVRLGGTGTLKSNPRMVLRARVLPDPGVERLDAYWVGRTFDTFDGREWHSSGTPLRTEEQVRLAPGGKGLVQQWLELLPAYGATTLVALDSPVLYSNGVVHSPQGSRRTSLVQLPGGEVRFSARGAGYSYHAFSMPVSRRPVAEGAGERDAERYLRLPATLDARVPELAARVLGGITEPLAAAERLAAYLRREYRYSLELPGEQEDPLAHFLFERREGHCEHFATALTVLLRSQGIPARVAGGFFGGERVADRYVLRAGDAHAWTQVLVPGRGWMTVDATPEGFRSAQPAATLAWLTDLYEQLEEAWRSRVVDFSFRDQVDMVRSMTRPAPRREAQTQRLRLPPARAWAAALGVALVVYAAFRLAERRTPRARPHAASRLLDAAERVLHRAGVERQPGEGLEELSARLGAAGHPLAPPLTRLTHRYLEARFGGAPLGKGEHRALVDALQVAARALPPPGATPRADGRTAAAR